MNEGELESEKETKSQRSKLRIETGGEVLLFNVGNNCVEETA